MKKVKKECFVQFQDVFTSLEYVKIKSWLYHNEPKNEAYDEIERAVPHAFCLRPFNFQFSDNTNETLARVFALIKKKKEVEKEQKRLEVAKRKKRNK